MDCLNAQHVVGALQGHPMEDNEPLRIPAALLIDLLQFSGSKCYLQLFTSLFNIYTYIYIYIYLYIN